jgi:hypothetical protein
MMPSRYLGEMDSALAISALVESGVVADSPGSEARARWTRARMPYWVLVGTENTYYPVFLSR